MWGALNHLQREGGLVDLKRERIESHTLRGFVTAVSADLVAMGVVNDECHFDGVTIVRTEDITFLRWQNEVLDAWAGVLQESPTSPTPVRHVELSSWESVVRSLLGSEPVVTFHREIVNDRACHLGTNISLEGECVVADEISVEGTVDGRFALSLGDLTKLDFGGGYEQALWRMVQKTRE